jgi:hypothetical protein
VWTNIMARFDDELHEACASVGGLDFVHVGHEASRYPVSAIDDPWSDRLGRIPYTDDYFTAVATVLCRRLWNVLHNSVEVVVVDAELLWRDGDRHPVAATLRRQSRLGRRVVLWSARSAAETRRKVEEEAELGLRWHRIARCHTGADIGGTVAGLVAAGDVSPERTVVLAADGSAAARVQDLVPELFAVARPPDGDEVARFLDHTWFLDPGGDPAEVTARRVFAGVAAWSRDVPSIRARAADQEVA